MSSFQYTSFTISVYLRLFVWGLWLCFSSASSRGRDQSRSGCAAGMKGFVLTSKRNEKAWPVASLPCRILLCSMLAIFWCVLRCDYMDLCVFLGMKSHSLKKHVLSILMVLVLSSHYRYILWSVLICVYDLLWIIFFLTWLKHTNSVITAVKIQFLRSGPFCSLLKPRTAHFDRKDCLMSLFFFSFFFLHYIYRLGCLKYKIQL